MIISDQTKNLAKNRSLGSSYINLATRFDKIPLSLIPTTKFVMKLNHLCSKLVIKNGVLNQLKILQKSYHKT